LDVIAAKRGAAKRRAHLLQQACQISAVKPEENRSKRNEKKKKKTPPTKKSWCKGVKNDSFSQHAHTGELF
jgi:hypothetical protein